MQQMNRKCVESNTKNYIGFQKPQIPLLYSRTLDISQKVTQRHR